MRYRHAFQVKAPLADRVAFYTALSRLKAITPPLIPMQFHFALYAP